MEKLVTSKQRVKEHGEVFTSEREVNAMLDLVKNETERIDSRFLEPACGDGNFLAEILKRKLAVVKRKYSKIPSEYAKYALIAVSSIYGVELLQDNAERCRRRLFEIFKSEYISSCGKKTNEEYLDAIRFILSRNILCGDTLSLNDSEGNPIIFSEWAIVTGNMVQRRDFKFNTLLNKKSQPYITVQHCVHDSETQVYLPVPIKEYPLTDYRRVQYADRQ